MIPLSTGDPLRLGPYRLLGTLGEGGMGKVYYGRDSAGSTAAVKVLRPELSHDQHLAQRFVREAVTAQAVTSTGVARVLGSQVEGGRPWIATEFLAGPTLEDAIVAHGPLDEATVRVLAASVARTLQDIHAAGLIHRDLKPSNIVLTSTGPRVIDFGIARPEHGLTLTTTGQVPVTPGYGAPEQVLGQRVGPAADIFSLGALLAYAASGVRAYDGPHAAAVQYQVVHGVPELRRVPEAVRPLVTPCLAKDPALRPLPAQVVRAFAGRGAARVWRRGPLAEEIRRREATAMSLAAALPPSDGATAAPNRRRLLALLGGGGAALGVAGAGAWWALRDPAPPKKRVIPAAATRPVAPLLEPNGEIAPLWGPVSGVDTDSPAPLPVRDVVILASDTTGLVAYRVSDGKQKWKVPGIVPLAGYITAADRLLVAADYDGSLYAFVASTGEEVWSVPLSAQNVLTSDGHAVYIMTKEGQLSAVRATTGEVLWSVPTPVRTSAVEPPASAASAGRLVLSPSDGHLAVLNATTGQAVWSIDGQSTSAVKPAIVGDKVYLGGSTLSSRALTDGKEFWSRPARSGLWGPPTIRGNELYATDHNLFRLRADNGKEQWDLYSPLSHNNVLPPVVQGGTVWVGGIKDDPLRAVDTRSGTELFTYWGTGVLPHAYAGDGNRVFDTRGGSLIAFPVRR
ncbi:protein kinase domain-containing protein [Streptomyces ficellus]|uniref:Serine/threonine protein kinase n=1 Tax=Streptomyces ficellus TaxID=1977088 RepID=A0A6I6FKT7_9ACTN|nr:serine/threonine-protein kinase [Streptomyces ficellus]QGV78178.1 serine/threonine protein kinase [Streptomyces ficellus]